MSSDPYAGVRAAVRRLEQTAAAAGPSFLRVDLLDDTATTSRGLSRMFDAFGATIDDLPKVLEEIVPDVRAAHRAVFSSQGAAGRGRWKALAPSTLAERKRLGFGPGPILVRTGALREHVLSTPAKITKRGDVVELRIEPDPMVDGVKKYRALAKGDGAVPARPMVAVGPAAARTITSTLQRALRARARANGLS